MKKIIFSIAFILFALSVSCIYSVAAENVGTDMKNDVRNVVGGAENVVEDTAKDVAGTIKGATSKMEQKANSATTR